MSKDERERAGLSQVDAAELVGVDRTAVYRAENGQRKGAVAGALRLLYAVWPELSADAKARVTAKLRQK